MSFSVFRAATSSFSPTAISLCFPNEGAEQAECRSQEGSKSGGVQGAKTMRRIFGVIWVVLALAMSGCSTAEADKTAEKNAEAAKAAAAKPAPPPKVIIPSGT